jgi:hypothetical protein
MTQSRNSYLIYNCWQSTLSVGGGQAGTAKGVRVERPQLHKIRNLTLHALVSDAGINFTYLSKIENGKFDFIDYQSEN